MSTTTMSHTDDVHAEDVHTDDVHTDDVQRSIEHDVTPTPTVTKIYIVRSDRKLYRALRE